MDRVGRSVYNFDSSFLTFRSVEVLSQVELEAGVKHRIRASFKEVAGLELGGGLVTWLIFSYRDEAGNKTEKGRGKKERDGRRKI